MSENKHIPEPWYYENCGEGFDIYDSDDHSVIDGSFGLIECEANARRIVAVVNACAGIETEMLEMVVEEGRTVLQDIEELTKQRDELLAAAEAIEINGEECLDFDECTAMLVPIDDYHKLVEAIASVKGGAA